MLPFLLNEYNSESRTQPGLVNWRVREDKPNSEIFRFTVQYDSISVAFAAANSTA